MKKLFFVLCPAVCAAMFSPALAADAECLPTAPDMLGPFYVSGMPLSDNGESINRFGQNGELLEVSGVVRSAADGNAPIADAKVEMWQTDIDGDYHPEDNGARSDYEDKELDLRGAMITDENGRYAYQTVVPGEYGIFTRRPPHFHYRISADGFAALTTQHYVRGEDGKRKQAGGKCRGAEIDRSGEVAVFRAPDIYLQPAGAQ